MTPKGKYKKELEILRAKYDEEELLTKSKRTKMTKSEEYDKKEKKDREGYLEFIAFTMSQNYSFSQISKLGKFLKTIKTQGMGFLTKYSFSEQEISKISTDCFGPFILGQLKEQLSTTLYSLSVDASTICGENILAIKAKFLEKQFDKETKEDLTIIQNKIVGIKTFGERSTGKDIHKAIEDKLFSNEQIKNNLIGVVHDNASSLTGENIGLLAILKKNNEKLFDLKDPCHGLSLAVNHAIDTLPKRIMGFVSKIHSFFISPQRTASLTRIQLENMKPIKKLKKFVKTRWLSLGISLDRLLEIWESLGLYMKESLQAKNTKEVQKKLKRFESQLRNDCFHLQLKFLAYIINKTNYFNEIFQNQSLPIEKLKETLTTSYKTILRLVVPLEKISNDNICKFLTFDWKDEKIQEEWFVMM